jgi:hypothetical protein
VSMEKHKGEEIFTEALMASGPEALFSFGFLGCCLHFREAGENFCTPGQTYVVI